MRPLISAISILWLAFASLANASGSEPPRPVAAPVAELSVTDAIILGVVEGVTEFLPISSTGHLIVATRFLGLESEQPLVGADGQPLWHKRPSEKNPRGEPLTVKLAADTYVVVIQIGAIAAVALLYWSQCVAMIRGVFGRDPAGLRLLINVMIAFVPAAGIGFLAHDWIDANLFSIGAVIIALVVGAALMLFADRWLRHRLLSQSFVRAESVHPSRNLAAAASSGSAATMTPPPRTAAPAPTPLDELTPKAAAGIGALQCLALWPGMSRSMTTIVGGYFAGLDPRRSAEFSFLLGLVTLSAASIYKGQKSGVAMIQVFGWGNVILGGIVAAVTAAVCVRFLVHWLTRHGLAMFAWYRLALAAVLAVIFYL